MHKERGFILWTIALGALLTVVTAALVFTYFYKNALTIKEAARDGQEILERAQKSSEEFQKEWDAALRSSSSGEQTEEKSGELRSPNAPFPQNPNEPLSNPLDVTVSEPVLDPRHEDSIEFILPPNLGFEEVIVEPTSKPISIKCSLGVIKYVGDYIYCVVSERPCIYSSCTFSRYFLDGTVDISVGKCQDEEYINPKSNAPLCSDLGI